MVTGECLCQFCFSYLSPSSIFSTYIVQRGEICFRTGAIIGNLFGYRDDNELFGSLTLNMILMNSVSSSSRNFLRISLQTSSKYITPFFSTLRVVVSRYLVHSRLVQSDSHFQLLSNKLCKQ